RKRKWDLDDQGKEAPPVSTASKSAKVDPSSDASESSAPSPTPSNSESIDPNVAAAVAAAKINAMLAAKGIQVPAKPLIITPKLDISENGSSEDSKASKKDSDLEFTHDITINDCKNRYLLTKGATQQQIQKETGADVTTRGKYYPDKLLATEKDPPLYLHVTASTKEALNAAINKISELMEQTFTPAPSTPTPRPPGQHLGRQFVQDKVFVGIEPDRTFNARAKIVGPQGAYVKHIQQETGAKVQLKGRGSGY
ncbi:8935_t:CDS:2, partial [Racocetra persica]